MTADDGAPDVGDGLPIRAASELLGVPAPTLRSWERRYALPATLRTEGGHRRYTEAALHELRLMRDEIAVGRPPADAARRVGELLSEQRPHRQFIQAIMAGSQGMDAGLVRTTLDQANTELGLAATLDGVVMPAMRQVGDWWATGRCDVGHEHYTTEVVRGWLAREITLAPGPLTEPGVLLAVGPRDRHTLGVEALAALLVHQGVGCRLLGSLTPQRVLVTAAVATSAAAVVVVSHLPTQRRSAVDSLRAVAESGAPTFFAGNAFLFESSRKGVAGTYLGETIAGAAEVIRAAVRPTR